MYTSMYLELRLSCGCPDCDFVLAERPLIGLLEALSYDDKYDVPVYLLYSLQNVEPP